MHFRVTSITWEDDAQMLLPALARVEDWLNKALSDGDFGGDLDRLMIVLMSLDVADTNDQRSAPKPSKLSSYKDPFTGKTRRVLALHISINAGTFALVDYDVVLPVVSSSIVENLPERPARVPKGLDYERLRKAIITCLSVFIGTPPPNLALGSAAPCQSA
ncbi:hypothetical protein E4K72_19795 [Oxalobacteraceae bacterium OM1]|nr:hypothetical protein E4K72_19795 [Oxalobacteraceae bacterium OM1]